MKINAPGLFRLLRHAVLALLATCAGAATADGGNDAFDILGFRLGMTPEQVRETFLRHNPKADIKTSYAAFRYSDGLNNLESKKFLSSMSANVRLDLATKNTLYISVNFAPPPNGGRVVQVSRTDSRIPNPVTIAELKESLVKKYGPPSGERYGFQWNFPAGRKPCSSSANGPVATQFSTLVQGRDRDKLLADPSQCASYLTYRPSGNPVTDLSARLVDVEAAIRAQQAADEWVAKLKAEAVAARKAKGQAPQL